MFLHAQLTLGISGFQCIWRSSEVSALFAAQTAVRQSLSTALGAAPLTSYRALMWMSYASGRDRKSFKSYGTEICCCSNRGTTGGSGNTVSCRTASKALLKSR